MTSHPIRSPAVPLPHSTDEGMLFRSLFAAYPDALLLVDLTGRVVRANPAAADLLGYAVEEVIGLNVDTFVPDSVRARHAGYREAYAHAPRARPMGTATELVAKRRDGTEVMVEVALSPLQDHGLPFVVAAIRGIGAYPRVKQALQRARYSEYLAHLGRLAVDTRDPQVLLDQVPIIATNALRVELAMLLLLESNGRELRVVAGVGLVPGEEVGARLPYRVDTSPGRVLAEGEVVIVPDYRIEKRFFVPPTYLAAGFVSALAVPVSDRGRTIGALTVRSRSAQRFGDDEVQFVSSLANLLAATLQRTQTEEALNHAQRLESVGQLTGGIAHDFNNLLTVIQGNLQVLEDRPSLAGDALGRQLLSAATRASHRAAELTNKLLAFSRRQVLQPAAIDLGLLLQSLSSMLTRTLDQRIRIEVDIAPDCPMALADPMQLESALLNIAINARDAMPDGGTLRFHAGPSGTLPPHVRRGLDDPSAPDERFVAIAVADSGTGMSDDVKERAFEPFFTTKEAGRGTGLGLSTVYGFVKQSKGTIALESAPGAGTKITLYIPQPWPDDRPAVGEATVAETVPPGLRVLLVEDDPEVRRVAQKFLEGMGCRVATASTAEQALAQLERRATYDLLLTDIALSPGMRGTQLADEVTRSLPEIAVLLMSGYSAELLEADREAPLEWELLRKPFSRGELAQAMARLLAAR